MGFNGIPDGLTDRNYWNNYRKFYIEFKDLLSEMDQCTIQSATDSVDNYLTGLNVVFSSSTISDFGSNLFFEPIPMEMLFTPVTKPQILVTIDDLEAVCANVDCNYEYVVASSEITAFTVTDLDVTITGTDLPESDLTVEFGGATCGTVSGDASGKTCTLEHLPYGGDHLIELTDASGLVPVSAST